MHKKRIAVGAVLLVAGVWKFHDSEPKPVTPQEVAPAAPIARQPAAPPPRVAKAVAIPALRPAEKALASLDEMSKTLFDFTRPETGMADLISFLESSHQQPVIARDANPYTGEMAVVRTKSPLAGTRYFHAQYFSDEEGSVLQHMSFEFKPGPDSMAEAVATVRKNLVGAKAPTIDKQNFIQWNLDGHYIVWVKRLDLEDLRDNPFNAYTRADAGTIRVAVEEDPHGEGEM